MSTTTYPERKESIAKDFTFGIEIETVITHDAVIANDLRIGNHRDGIQVPYLPEGWTASHDGSINYHGRKHACEIVSPILKGEEGLRQVVEVVKILHQKGHTTNQSCGIHVHVGFANKSAHELAKLTNIISYMEKALYSITGTHKREQGNWCRSVRQYGECKNYLKPTTTRYHVLNTKNLKPDGKQTVEFRCFPNSLNHIKIVGWIQVCLGLVEKALTCKRVPTWEGKKAESIIGIWKKDGVGATEVERLLAYLCWGNYGYHPSHLTAYGWLGNVIPQETIKKEFRRLAATYDNEYRLR